MVCNKPAGISTELQNHEYASLEQQCRNYLRTKYPGRKHYYLRPAHRLDRPASGIVIFAKTHDALISISQQIELRTISKNYTAIVEGKMQTEAETLQHWLLKNNMQKKSVVVNPHTKDSREAVLHYQVLKSNEKYSHLQIRLETGRYHQVRCQLAQIGHPVVNDFLYGAEKKFDENMIGLHAVEYVLRHPKTLTELQLFAPLPDDACWSILTDIT